MAGPARGGWPLSLSARAANQCASNRIKPDLSLLSLSHTRPPTPVPAPGDIIADLLGTSLLSGSTITLENRSLSPLQPASPRLHSSIVVLCRIHAVAAERLSVHLMIIATTFAYASVRRARAGAPGAALRRAGEGTSTWAGDRRARQGSTINRHSFTIC